MYSVADQDCPIEWVASNQSIAICRLQASQGCLLPITFRYNDVKLALSETVCFLAPVIASVSPSSGLDPAGGGTLLVSGSNFGFLGSVRVMIGNHNCDKVTLFSRSSLSCTTSPGTGFDNVVSVSNRHIAVPGSTQLSNSSAVVSFKKLASISIDTHWVSAYDTVTVSGEFFGPLEETFVFRDKTLLGHPEYIASGVASIKIPSVHLVNQTFALNIQSGNWEPQFAGWLHHRPPRPLTSVNAINVSPAGGESISFMLDGLSSSPQFLSRWLNTTTNSHEHEELRCRNASSSLSGKWICASPKRRIDMPQSIDVGVKSGEFYFLTSRQKSDLSGPLTDLSNLAGWSYAVHIGALSSSVFLFQELRFQGKPLEHRGAIY